MSDEVEKKIIQNIKESWTPNTEEKSYTPNTGKEQGSFTPTTSQGGNDELPLPKKK